MAACRQCTIGFMPSSSGRLGAGVMGLIGIVVAGVIGCRPSHTPPEPQPAPPPPRIVSLSPALTRTLVDLGLEDHIVGRTEFSRSVDPRIAVVGNLYELDYERLIRLKPTHVLVQPPAGGVDKQLERLCQSRGWQLRQWKINTIQDIERTIRELPLAVFSANDGRLAGVTRRAAELLDAIAHAVSPPQQELWGGPTLLVADTEPVLAFGRRTYLNDCLVALGGRNVVETEGWVELSLEDVVRLDPAAIILVRDRRPADGAAADRVLAKLDIAAVRNGRIEVLFHPDAVLPSSSVIGVAGELRRVLQELGEPGP